MKTAIEISFLFGAGMVAVGLWLLAPWLSLAIMGLLIMLSAGFAYFNEPAKPADKAKP